MSEKQPLSEILTGVFHPELPSSSVGEVVDRLNHHGLAVVLILFSIPSALPIPAAGYSTILSIPLMIIGLHLLFGRTKVWLPNSLRKTSFSPQSFSKMYELMMKVVRFVERFSKPRITKLVNGTLTKFFIGVLICALATSMILPIPGTNTLPAGGIFLIGFAFLEDDGILLLAGVIYSLTALTITTLIIFFGYEVVKSALLAFLS